MSDCPKDPKCEKFADYLVENYVAGDSKFPPEMWAGVPSDEKRTNNGTESFHAHFNGQFYSAHPTIFVFIDILKKVQATTYVRLRSMDTPAPLRRSEKEKLEYLKEQFQKFSSDELSRLEFVKIVGYRFSAVTEL